MKRIYLTIFAALSLLCANAQQTADNAPENNSQEKNTTAADNDNKTTTLKELVVTGENAWFEGNKAVFVPRKNEKNLAIDAVSLIDNMGTPLLYVKENKIMSRTGGAVTIFINGNPADDTDLRTFWPQNAIRVEYIQNPDDPKFRGATNVVNFIMKEYTFGGLTKLDAWQTFPNNGNYNLSSKFAYKKMTFNATVGGSYNRDHQTGSYENQTFDDVWYNGNFYERIDRTEFSDDNAIRNDNIKAAFNARYTAGQNFVATHNASFLWNRNPESHQNGSVFYTPSLFDGTGMHTHSKDRKTSAEVSGNYYFRISDKFSMNSVWRYTHSHNNRFSSNTEGEKNAITTRSRENANAASLDVNFFWRLNPAMNIQGAVSEKRSWHSTLYEGSSLDGADSRPRQWQHRGQTELILQWYYQINPDLYIAFRPQLSIADWNINHQVRETKFMPSAMFWLNYTINRKNYLNINFSANNTPPSAASTNEMILRESELVWIEGNPHIESLKSYYASINYSWIPLNWLDMNFTADWSLWDNWEYFTYTPGGQDYDGVIKRYSNTANYGCVHFKYDLNVKLFKNHLRLMAGVEFDHNYFTGTHRSYNFVRPELRANAFFGNCNAGITYYFKSKSLKDGGTTMRHAPEQLWLFFGYGTGNFNLLVSLSNPFVKHSVYRYIINSGPYHNNKQEWTTGRSVSLSLAYTFDYGKKIDPRIDVSVTSGAETSVLGN